MRSEPTHGLITVPGFCGAFDGRVVSRPAMPAPVVSIGYPFAGKPSFGGLKGGWRRIQHVLMDVDGVIVPARPSFRDWLSEHGISDAMTAPFFKGPFQECLVGRADLPQVLTPYLPQWGWRQGVEAFMAIWFRVEQGVNSELLTMLDALRRENVGVHLATNQEAHRTGYLLSEMGLAAHVEQVFASCRVGHIKPSESYLSAIVSGLGCSKGELLLWDDSPYNVEQAREFGLKAELFHSAPQFRNRMRDYFPLLIL
ncbi:HAD family hydrolase [Sulfobacillus harzensis]|uniref:HAD hydrolase-like protein n=1 Tax=Sulfobacillus harzensis TaxID=2729629 RepID=A0A7Y0L5K4_9FIRM|nr:HAD family hydrolase [Sulfobacillus harzensis]NMP23712.1 HAD hydrolase-like protein [Sulfobacillus harzensis]